MGQRAKASVNDGKEVPCSMSSHRSQFDRMSNIRTGSRDFGLPPPSKFRSGHLSGVIPVTVSRVIPGDADDSGSASDNAMTTDTEEDVYGERYSLDSSPQDDRVPSSTIAQRQYIRLQERMQHASDSVFSDDVSSSRETIGRGRGHVVDRLRRRTSRYPLRRSTYTGDESSDSADSSEFSTTQARSVDGGLPHTRASLSEGYACVPSHVIAESATEKDLSSKTFQNHMPLDDDVPSAAPFFDSTGEIKQEAEHVSTSRPYDMPFVASPHGLSTKELGLESILPGVKSQNNVQQEKPEPCARTASVEDSGVSSGSFPARLPTFHASALEPWHAFIAYDACVRLCLHAWAKGCMEAPMFLENECALLQSAFCLQQVLLQSEEELLVKRSSDHSTEGAATKPKKMFGKMKVQVRKVKMALDPPAECSFSTLGVTKLKKESIHYHFSKLRSSLSSGWHEFWKVWFAPRVPANGSFSRQSLSYMQASNEYIRQDSEVLKVGVTPLCSSPSSYEVQETYSCLLRLKSSTEDDVIQMQPGSGETHVFFPDGQGDDLIVEVQDSKGKHCGRVLAQVVTIAEDPGDKLRWWSIYRETEHVLVGKVQLYIDYYTTLDENSHLKCGSVAKTVAYDLVLEVAMKVQHFQQRNLMIHGPWKWLLNEFVLYYGVSDAYTKLRYLSYVMDVATPTTDCLTLVYDLLMPVLVKGHSRITLSHQENRILGEIQYQIEYIFTLVFENYKSLDESSPSGIMEVFRPATGVVAPALNHAVKLFTLCYDILSPGVQNKLYSYFQAAAKKRSRRHLSGTDKYVGGNNEGILMDTVVISTAYQKMKSLCSSIRNEIFTDIEIHNQNILPSFIDLPNLSSAIYNEEVCSRLHAFLVACPPASPSPPVTELVIATADFERDLSSWNINAVKGGVNAKELFHLYIILWIQDKRLSLLESCKLDEVKWSGVRTQHSTTPFVDEMYDHLRETLNNYDVIMCRWPEYTFVLENAIADVEKAVVEALEKQYADVLSPLKENLTPKKFGLKYVHKLTKRSVCPYVVTDDLGILLNSMKRMLDVLHPMIDSQIKSWGACIPDVGNTAPGERLSEVTVMLRSKFRNYLQVVVEKLAENTRLQNSTKLKKILQDSKESVVESDIRSRMQPLKEQLTNTMNHLHIISGTQVFIAFCRGYWDRMGQDVLSFLESRKENRTWYKGSRLAVSILDDTFASQMQQLLGNALQEKDVEPPRSIVEVRSMLCGHTYY